MVNIAPDVLSQPTELGAVVARVREQLASAPVAADYRSALSAALALPGNILSDQPNARWAHPILTCCTAAGGEWSAAIAVAAAVEVLMVALDLLDDEEDGETHALHVELGASRTLNVTTGLLFLTQWNLLNSTVCPSAASILVRAALQACSGQHIDLSPVLGQELSLENALTVTQDKSGALVAAFCSLGALCAAAEQRLQELYAHFGFYLGMIRQLNNDIAALHPDATAKTDITLGRPTLPLTYAACHASTGGRADQPGLWASGPAYLTWTVAEVYRRQACALIPHLTGESTSRAKLLQLIPGVQQIAS